jgi:hypothetical protein
MTLPQLTDAETSQLIQESLAYLRQQHDFYLSQGKPLSLQQTEVMRPFFPPSVLADARIVMSQDHPVPNPAFIAKLRERGFPLVVDLHHVNVVSFFDVQVLHTLNDRHLFHGLVHAVQFRVLGIERSVECYVRALLKTGLHVAIPFEAHAYELDARFAQDPSAFFSVEEEIKSWAAADRY